VLSGLRITPAMLLVATTHKMCLKKHNHAVA